MHEASELGAENIYAAVHARLYRHSAGHRIVVDDTGAYEIAPDGRTVTFVPREGSWPDFVRAHLIGRVLATTMYLDGWLPLHASAVSLRDGIVAFLAPKGFGKSSLALAMTQRGARLVTDDTLPVEAPDEAAPRAWPGVHSLRVRDDSVTALGLSSERPETREGKWLVNDLPPERRLDAPRPLDAIYLVDPTVSAAGTPAAARTRLASLPAALGVVAHVKIGRMLGPGAAGPMLQRATAISGKVPVYQLHAARDLGRLDELAETIVAWHGGTG
jgi:hypothetical protein